jgi:hypothetical protein
MRAAQARGIRAILTVGLLLLVAGCAHHYTSESVAEPYGFLSGIWHGIVFTYALLTNVVSWLCSLAGFDLLSSIEIIGRPNTGVLFYYVGFVLGLCAYGGAAR